MRRKNLINRIWKLPTTKNEVWTSSSTDESNVALFKPKIIIKNILSELNAFVK